MERCVGQFFNGQLWYWIIIMYPFVSLTVLPWFFVILKDRRKSYCVEWSICLYLLDISTKDRHSPWYTTRKSHFPPWNFATSIGFSWFFQLMGIHSLTFTTSQCDLRLSIPHWLMWAIGLRYKEENWHVTQTRCY